MVTITGGAEVPGRKYSWTVANNHTSPIVRIEFPHYRVGLFFAPKGWSTDQSTFLVSVGVPVKPGLCVAEAASSAEGIASGKSTEFSAQLATGAVRRRAGQVLVRFADGTEFTVAGVELPQREAISDSNVSLIGLGVIFVAWLFFQLIRSRRRSRT